MSCFFHLKLHGLGRDMCCTEGLGGGGTYCTKRTGRITCGTENMCRGMCQMECP